MKIRNLGILVCLLAATSLFAAGNANLQPLAGNWTCTGTAYASDMGPEHPTKATVVNRRRPIRNAARELGKIREFITDEGQRTVDGRRMVDGGWQVHSIEACNASNCSPQLRRCKSQDASVLTPAQPLFDSIGFGESRAKIVHGSHG